MGAWGSTTRIGRGASWKRRCPTAAATPIPGSVAIHERRNAGSAVPGTVRGARAVPSWNAGGDGPAWSRKRQPFEAPGSDRGGGPGSGSVPYAELHCHSNFSFLDGASHPEELVTEAARLGLEALALTDHNGFYGIVRFAEAARELGMPTIFGTELTPLLGNQVRGSDSRGGDAHPGRHRASARRHGSGSPRRAPAAPRRRADAGTPSWPGRSASVTSPGRRARRSSPSPTSPESSPVTRGRSPAAARAPSPPHSSPTGRPRRPASSTA